MHRFRLLIVFVASAVLFLPIASAVAKPRFDVQAHRGGLGLVTESTLEVFANAIELGVSTLELDVQITEDGQAVVTQTGR